MFLFRLLFKRDNNRKMDIDDAFKTPCVSGDLKLLKKLVLHGKKNVNAYSEEGYTPLQYCLQNQHDKCSLFLLDQRANPNAYCRNPVAPYKTLWPYVHANNLSNIRLLTIYGADRDGIVFIAGSEAEACFNMTRNIYQQIKNLAKKPETEYYNQLAKLWRKVAQAETQNDIYKKHYKQKADYYQQMAKEPSILITEQEEELSDSEKPLLSPSSP